MIETFFAGFEREGVELSSRQRLRSVWSGGLHKSKKTRRRMLGMGTDKRQIMDGRVLFSDCMGLLQDPTRVSVCFFTGVQDGDGNRMEMVRNAGVGRGIAPSRHPRPLPTSVGYWGSGIYCVKCPEIHPQTRYPSPHPLSVGRRKGNSERACRAEAGPRPNGAKSLFGFGIKRGICLHETLGRDRGRLAASLHLRS